MENRLTLLDSFSLLRRDRGIERGEERGGREGGADY